MFDILRGLRIVEGTAFVAAPLCGMTLAQLGADVIRFDGPSLRAAAEADPALGYELMKRFTEVLVDRMQSIRIQLLDVYSTFR